MRVSFVIPYKQRLTNLRMVFEALAGQDVGAPPFEVVLGVMEHDDAYTGLCREFEDRLTIVSVVTARDWQVGRARNMALLAATGDVVVLLDADMVLPPNFVCNIWERHFADGQQQCVVGQMIEYDNNAADVIEVRPRSFSEYADLLRSLEVHGPGRSDARLGTAHVIPWAFAWTALIALPRSFVMRHDLLFDLAFRGYGVEDLEWAYRVSTAGLPIVMAEDVFGIHLPHARNVAANRVTERVNYLYFLGKWPSAEVELAVAYGDFEANNHCATFLDTVASAFDGARPAVARGDVAGVDTLVVGGSAAQDQADETVRAMMFDDPASVRVLPLVGLALPFTDGEVAECVVTEAIERLVEPYRSAVLSGSGRVSRSPVRVGSHAPAIISSSV